MPSEIAHPGVPLWPARRVLVSSTVKDLVADSGIELDDRASRSSRASPASGDSCCEIVRLSRT